MSDPRFFKNSGPFTLEEIYKFIGKELLDSKISNNYLVVDIATLGHANDGNITFFQDLKYKDDLLKTKASVCILKKLKRCDPVVVSVNLNLAESSRINLFLH